jgi:UDP-2,3-diacylglucosamine pyrophosphatase LpxH
MRHRVAISDVHLCEHEPGEGLWMRWRQAPYSPDDEIAEMLDALRREVQGESLELVLNGDIFDFDAPRTIDGRCRFHDFPRDAAHDVPAMEAILDHHPIFVAALGRVLADGHTLVIVSGNHDVQLTLPPVRDVLRRRVVDAALAAAPGGERAAIEARVHFRAWFHRTPDGIVFEHGNQYDPYCCFRYPMAPYGRADGTIQPTLGSLAFRYLISRMGYFNPHVDSSFMLTPLGYLAHWARYYLFSRRALFALWPGGAARTLRELWRWRAPPRRARHRESLIAAARETGAPLVAVARHARLFARPVEDRLHLVARQLWIDRVALLLVSAAVAAACLLLAPAAFAPAAALPPVLFLAYEAAAPRLKLGESWRGIRRAARRVARAHRARAVVFGHTHNPEGTWEDGVFYGNTGSWSAAFADVECTRPLSSERPIIWLRADGDQVTGGLVVWKGGRFEAKESENSAARPPSEGLGSRRGLQLRDASPAAR